VWQGFSAKAKAGFDSAKSHLDGAKADVLEEADRIKQLKKFQLMDLEIFDAESTPGELHEAVFDVALPIQRACNRLCSVFNPRF
jgi:hypothetical protein